MLGYIRKIAWTDRSAALTILLPLPTHALGRHVLIALGKTYNAISPLLLPFSIQMLLPHVKHPANTHPYGPSQKSCEICGSRRASKSVRELQTANQKDETKVDRKATLRSAARDAESATRKRSTVWGRINRMGIKWAL